MDNERRKETLLAFCIGLFVFALCACPSVPPVIVDTTDVDAIAVDIAGTAGAIETQTVTVYETVTKLIYNASPEEKALVESQFAAIRASVAHIRGLPARLIEAFGAKARADAAEIARLRTNEVEKENEKAKKWRAYTLAGFLLFVIVGYIAFKVLRP